MTKTTGLAAVAALLAAISSIPPSSAQSWAQSQAQTFRPPTATELWTLRSKCTELGEQKRQKEWEAWRERMKYETVEYSPAGTVEASYNPTDNRCYIHIQRNTLKRDKSNKLLAGYTELYDGQTGTMLAVAVVLYDKDPTFYHVTVNDPRYVLPGIPWAQQPDDMRERDRWYHQRQMDQYDAVLDYMNRLMHEGKP